MMGINYELFDIYIYIYTHTHSTLKNFTWTKSLKLIKPPCDMPIASHMKYILLYP